jgi:uncharacterized membrane protein
MTRIEPTDHSLPPPDGPVYLDATLRPNVALSGRGFQIVMVAMAAGSFVVGCLFLSLGAWPVIGFFGVDVLLLWLAFRSSFARAGREREQVRVTGSRIDVRRTSRTGQRAGWFTSPHFARVIVERPEHTHPEVGLAAGPDRLALATCLSPQERIDFAGALENAIRRARAERHPATA